MQRVQLCIFGDQLFIYHLGHQMFDFVQHIIVADGHLVDFVTGFVFIQAGINFRGGDLLIQRGCGIVARGAGNKKQGERQAAEIKNRTIHDVIHQKKKVGKIRPLRLLCLGIGGNPQFVIPLHIQ